MRFRKLRIAFSATCGIACVLLIALWVRSYWWEDGLSFGITEKRGFWIFSTQGKVAVQYISFTDQEANISQWFIASYELGEAFWLSREIVDSTVLGFYLMTKNGFAVAVPHWFLLLSMGTAVTLVLKRSWLFSLRTPLIATTLIAVVLGLIVWLAH